MLTGKATREILIASLAVALAASSCPVALVRSAQSTAPSPAPTPTPPPFGGDQNLEYLPEEVDVWTQPSVFAGEYLNLHVSSPTPNYSVSIKRETYVGTAGPAVVFSEARTDGIDQRNLVTWDAATATARSPWPTSFSIDTTDWSPGVYTISTTNGLDTQSAHGIFVVKTPTIQRGYPLFPLNFLTMQAYNRWGGASAYTPNRAVAISLQRPFENPLFEGPHGWAPQSAWLAWMSQHVVNLQYTTDFDVSLAAPTINPSALILGQHTEYISKVFRDWIDGASGDAGVVDLANFGTNAFYCQVRLVNGVEGGSPAEMLVYKWPGQDELEQTSPSEAAVFFRSATLHRPEGALFGAQYGASNAALGSRSMIVGAGTPLSLLKGTGLRPGSRLVGLYYLEADYLYPTVRPQVIGSATYKNGKATRRVVTVIRIGKRGARIFNAGSLVWVTGFAGTTPFGMKRKNFIRFNANILDWLRIKRQ